MTLRDIAVTQSRENENAMKNPSTTPCSEASYLPVHREANAAIDNFQFFQSPRAIPIASADFPFNPDRGGAWGREGWACAAPEYRSRALCFVIPPLNRRHVSDAQMYGTPVRSTIFSGRPEIGGLWLQRPCALSSCWNARFWQSQQRLVASDNSSITRSLSPECWSRHRLQH